MQHVLVTGGAGYIGSHTCKALARRGMQPVVLDNLVYGHRWAVRWGPFYEGDVGDAALVQHIVREHGIESMLHFAAYAYVGESMQHPEKYFDNNVVRGLALLQAARETGVRHMVFSSTCAVYGEPEKVPISEAQTPRPVNPYGESKLFLERALHWLGTRHDLQWIALRYFNAAGADPEGEIGEDHDPETHLVPLVIQAALGRIPQVQIFGNDYPTPDGTAIRDYIHVTDLAAAHVKALEYLQRGGTSTAVNLGTGRGHSVRQLVHTMETIAGRPVPAIDAPRRLGDPPELVADPTRAHSLLEWSPRYSALEQILETAWRWHRKQEAQPKQTTHRGSESP